MKSSFQNKRKCGKIRLQGKKKKKERERERETVSRISSKLLQHCVFLKVSYKALEVS